MVVWINTVKGLRYENNSIYYSTIAPFYHIRAKECTKYATLLHCRTGQNYGLKAERQNGRSKLYFTSGHFAHCSYFSLPLWGSEKYYAIRKISAYYMLNHRIRCMYCHFAVPCNCLLILSHCKGNRGTNSYCLLRQLSWLKHCVILEVHGINFIKSEQ